MKTYESKEDAVAVCDKRQRKETNTVGAWKVYETPRGRFRVAYDSAKFRGEAETAVYVAWAY